MKIERNKNPAGRFRNIGFGLCCIGDGLVRVLSLGFLHSSLCLDYARETARRSFRKLRRASEELK